MARRSQQQRHARAAKSPTEPVEETKVEVVEESRWRALGRSFMLLVMGGFFCFYGHLAFSTVCFFSGFTVLGAVTRIACFQVLGAPKTSTQSTNYNSLALIVGLFGGQFLHLSERLSFGCIGALGGFFFGLYLLCAARYTNLVPASSRLALIFSFVMTGILTTSQMETTYVAFSTAFTGAFVLVYGMDGFLRTGIEQYLTKHIVGFSTETENELQSSNKLAYYSLLSLVIPFFWLGCLSQLEKS
ncbi:hypothetical protein K493DRAFT_315015 [Basidiobolus meristosporus CBS 931.73]|uniref:Transmembrane protein 198 n=1 Tax=Basidiobolus meristosporus CBS 931.73 TaxID=1314790 RepID=A0A1Y1YBU9_9FUNG|nr:hypothetical protein K493DRAFT_315015 [Basidiobolus meristosporus CBS 931.73]|eukprot:ORX95432.1 hypothetical protein K493DRAFT_315015 [Basidiobolus meristosporus CBS 931.73]